MPLPNPRAGPTVINCFFNQPCPHWIHVNIVDLLHKHRFTENWQHILLLLPERVAVLSLPRFMSQLRERTLMILLFQIINHSAADPFATVVMWRACESRDI